MIRDLALAHRESLLSTLRALVALESPTHDKAAVDRLRDHLQARLETDGWQVERLPQEAVGDQLIARWPAEGAVSTLLLCHIDTVWPVGTLAQMPIREEGDRFYGPGALDMKAGVANAIEALRLITLNALTLQGPVTLLLTSDEEKGSHHSRALIEREARAHSRVLVLEPGREDGALKTERKGTGDFRVTFKGVSAHAGNNPQDGASALRELAHFVLFAESLTDYDLATTVNVTVANAGSTTNVIAETALAQIDMRALRLAEAERVRSALNAYCPRDPRVTVTVEGGLNRPPLELTEANQQLLQETRSKLSALGLTLAEAVVGGGSDGNFTSALGVPTLDGLGAVGEGPHARHEHIRVTETLERLALLIALLTR
jgi:glutamate carboxypeptidase